MTPDGDALGLPRRQRPDQRQHLRRPRAADQLRGGRVRARAGGGGSSAPTSKTGQIEVLTERYEGKRYNSPNDVVRRHPGPHLVHRPVLRRRPLGAGDGRRGRLPDRPGRHGRRGCSSQPAIERPNGLAITPDGRTLYVIDSHTRPGGNRKVWAFDVDARRRPQRPAPGLRLRPGPRRRRHAARRARQPLGRRRDQLSPATPARPPTSRPASTSSRPTASCSAASPSPRTSAPTSPSAAPTARRSTSSRARPSTRSRRPSPGMPSIRRRRRSRRSAPATRRSAALAILHPRGIMDSGPSAPSYQL